MLIHRNSSKRFTRRNNFMQWSNNINSAMDTRCYASIFPILPSLCNTNTNSDTHTDSNTDSNTDSRRTYNCLLQLV